MRVKEGPGRIQEGPRGSRRFNEGPGRVLERVRGGYSKGVGTIREGFRMGWVPEGSGPGMVRFGSVLEGSWEVL